MKPCIGCKHLRPRYGRCHGVPITTAYEVNPLTGYGRTFVRGPDGSEWMPTVEDTRAPGGLCGPERLLFEPKWPTRLWNWMERKAGAS